MGRSRGNKNRASGSAAEVPPVQREAVPNTANAPAMPLVNRRAQQSQGRPGPAQPVPVPVLAQLPGPSPPRPSYVVQPAAAGRGGTHSQGGPSSQAIPLNQDVTRPGLSQPLAVPVRFPRGALPPPAAAGRTGTLPASLAGSSNPPRPAGPSVERPPVQPRPPPTHRPVPPAGPAASQASTSSPQAATGRPFSVNLTIVASSSAVTKQEEAGSTRKHNMPLRNNGPGRDGFRLEVRTNHFRVTVDPKKAVELNHYHVDISPKVKSRGFCRVLMKTLWASKGWGWEDGRWAAAYDGRSSLFTAGRPDLSDRDNDNACISAPETQGEAGAHDVDALQAAADVGGPRTFTVKLKHVDHEGKLRLSDLEGSEVSQVCVQALDVVFREGLLGRCVAIGRSLFDRNLHREPLGREGFKVARGFFQSIRSTEQGLSLNVDACAIPVLDTLPVLEFLRVWNALPPRGDARYDPGLWRGAESELRGRWVRAIHRQNRRPRYLVRGLSAAPVSQLSFSRAVEGGLGVEQTTVEDYFAGLELVRTIGHPNYPCLDVGTDDRPNYLPMEFCEMADWQRVEVKGTAAEKPFRDLTSRNPTLRSQDISRIVAANGYNDNVEAFGVQVDTNHTLVTARVLESPELMFAPRDRPLRPLAPKKQWAMIRRGFQLGGSVTTWAWLALGIGLGDERSRKGGEIGHFCRRLGDKCVQLGMQFPNGPCPPLGAVETAQDLETLLSMRRQQGPLPKLLIVVLPSKSLLYGELKRICETGVGVMSQCCDVKNTFASRAGTGTEDQYLANLALKVNMKMGGRNAVLSLALRNAQQHIGGEASLRTRVWGEPREPWILLGADVNHPSPAARKEGHKSVAAVVATQDWPEMATYAGSVRSQTGGQEKIENLEEMVRELLQSFAKRTGRKARRILFYRDGVGEGQFEEVLDEERGAVVQAARTDAAPGATLTFVVVQKRHHTRFFPVVGGGNDGVLASGDNIPSGTVVDTVVCHPTDLDFYLCSHNAGLPACVRPAHYHLLWDENGFTSDTLQRLTYNLCYMYGRCTKPVSLVPPAFYAHHLATRGRHYMRDGINLPLVTAVMQSTMFFC